MKLVKHEIYKQPNGTVRVQAEWRDQMRRPVDVEILTKTGSLASDSVNTLAEGSAEEVAKTFFGIAEIAWGMGWRPRALSGSVAHFIQAFKLPPEDA
jgi:hypothetical protein